MLGHKVVLAKNILYDSLRFLSDQHVKSRSLVNLLRLVLICFANWVQSVYLSLLIELVLFDLFVLDKAYFIAFEQYFSVVEKGEGPCSGTLSLE